MKSFPNFQNFADLHGATCLLTSSPFVLWGLEAVDWLHCTLAPTFLGEAGLALPQLNLLLLSESLSAHVEPTGLRLESDAWDRRSGFNREQLRVQ